MATPYRAVRFFAQGVPRSRGLLPVLLIGFNYLRAQWLTMLIMAVYLVGIAGVFSLHQQSQEVLFFLRSQPLYVIFLSVMLAVPALQTDSKSRRILAVLSKGIHRWQYLGGILCGCAMMNAVFSLLIWAIAYNLCVRGGYPTDGLALLTLTLFGCCLTASSAGLTCSIFLHPLIATGMATLCLLLPLPYVLRGAPVPLPEVFFPVSSLIHLLLLYNFGDGGGLWKILASSLFLALVFWVAGAAIFSRRDVTISPE